MSRSSKENDSMEPKKLALLRILEILKRHSDEEHHLKQEDIIELLERDYALSIERKAVSRNLSLLKEAGYEIGSDKKGSWLAERPFEKTELRILIDSILSSRFISPKRSKELIEKLLAQAPVYFRSNLKHIHALREWNKTDVPGLYENIETICDAIDRRKPVQITQQIYHTDKELHEGYTISVTPAAVFIVDQEYLLLYVWNMDADDPSDNNEFVIFMTTELRSLSSVRILEDKKAFDTEQLEAFRHKSIPQFILDNGLDKEGTAHTLETAQLQRITFVCQSSCIWRVLDRFGKDVRITSLPELDKNLYNENGVWDHGGAYKGLIKVSVRTTERAAVAFVSTLGIFACILSPESLKQEYLKETRLAARFCETIEEEIARAGGNKNSIKTTEVPYGSQ